MIDLAARPARVDTVLFRALDGEAVLLHMPGGTYYGLNAVACAVWQAMDGATSVAALARRVSAEYAVTEPEAAADVLALVTDLAEAGLVRLEAPPAGRAP